jgi:hypothetical protein
MTYIVFLQVQIGINGWLYEYFPTLSQQRQEERLKLAKDKLSDLFKGSKTNLTVFIPPFNAQDDTTLQALIKQGKE